MQSLYHEATSSASCLFIFCSFFEDRVSLSCLCYFKHTFSPGRDLWVQGQLGLCSEFQVSPGLHSESLGGLEGGGSFYPAPQVTGITSVSYPDCLNVASHTALICVDYKPRVCVPKISSSCVDGELFGEGFYCSFVCVCSCVFPWFLMSSVLVNKITTILMISIILKIVSVFIFSD